MKYFKLNEKIRIILEYILVILIMLDCNTVLVHRLDKHINIKLMILSTSIILVLFLINQIRLTKRDIVIFAGIFLFLIFYFMIFISFNKSDNKVQFLVRFMFFLPVMVLCFLLYKKINKTFTLYYKFSDIMIFLAIISIVFWIGCSILKIIQLNSQVSIEWGGNRIINGFYNIYYETQKIKFLGYSGWRNTGIFTEAPMFSLCLSIAFITEMFLKDRLSNKRILVLGIAIFTTFSTTGYIIVLLSIFGKFFNYRNIKSKFMRIFKVFLAIIITFLLVYLVIFILRDKITSNSYSVRIGYYVKELSIWKENLIFGSGYGVNERGSSNSVGVILADGGLWLIIIYLYSFIIYIFQRKNKNLIWFSICFFLLAVVTVFPYSMMMIMFLGSAISFTKFKV